MINNNALGRLLRISLLLVVCAFNSFVGVNAQNIQSKAKVYFTAEDIKTKFMPPELYVNVGFSDKNNNSILEALESGDIRLTVSNLGGDANDVNVSVVPMRPMTGLTLPKQFERVNIKSGKSVDLSFPISADIRIPTDSILFKINVTEPGGFDISARMRISTFQYQKSKLSMQGIRVIDSGQHLRAVGTPNGIMQKGEIVKVIATVQNVGQGEANGVSWTLSTKDPNLRIISDNGYVDKMSGTLEDLKVGQTAEIECRVAANNNYSSTQKYVPLFLTVTEDKGFGNISGLNLPLALGAAPQSVTVVDVKPDYDKLAHQQKAMVYSEDSRVNTNIRDINVAPAGQKLFKNAIAVVIGVEKNQYKSVPAPYAANDARIISNYFKTSLGISDVILLTDEQALSSTFADTFDPRIGTLARRVTPGVTDVFVFYSGHGMPSDTVDGDRQISDVYLYPYDARLEFLQTRGYSLSKLYNDLNSLQAKSVTVILDACFSGSSRPSLAYQEQSLNNGKGVVISKYSLSHRPWETNPNFRLFTSSTGTQTSLGFDETESGLFTYYLACGLQGDADSNGDGSITMDELVGFVTDNVSKKSKMLRSTEQMPQFFGNGDFVIEKIR